MAKGERRCSRARTSVGLSIATAQAVTAAHANYTVGYVRDAALWNPWTASPVFDEDTLVDFLKARTLSTLRIELHVDLSCFEY